MIERLIEIIQNAKFAKWALHDKVLFLAKLLFEQNCIMQVCDKDERLIDTKLFYSYVVNKKKYLLKTYLLQNQPEYLLNTTSVFIFSILHQERSLPIINSI